MVACLCWDKGAMKRAWHAKGEQRTLRRPYSSYLRQNCQLNTIEMKGIRTANTLEMFALRQKQQLVPARY